VQPDRFIVDNWLSLQVKEERHGQFDKSNEERLFLEHWIVNSFLHFDISNVVNWL
jgi:hypothetical protein